MNDRQLLDQLDQRATKAATDLHRRAQSRPRPEFDADAPQVLTLHRTPDSNGRRPTRLLAVAAVIILLVAVVAVGVAVTRRSSPTDQRPAGDPDSTEVQSVAPRPYVATDLPNGFKVAGAADVPPDGSRSAQSRFSTPTPGVQLYTLFGPSEDDPRLAVTLGVLVTPSRSDDTFTVEGRTLIAMDDPRAGGQRVALAHGDESLLLVAPALDRLTLGRLAVRTRLAGFPPTLLAKDLPKDWKRLGTFLQEVRQAPVAVSGELGPAYRIEYVQPVPGGRPVSYDITSRSGDEASVNAYRLFARQTETIEVRGHRGLLATVPSDDPGRKGTGRVLTWLERPGEMIEINAAGGSKADLLKVAEGLRPAADAEFKKAVLLSTKSAFGTEAPPVGTGQFPDGTVWVLRSEGSTKVNNGPTPNFEASIGASHSRSSIGRESPNPLILPSATLIDGRRFGYGFVTQDVARVAIVSTGRSPARATIVDNGMFRGWVVEVTGLTDPVAVAYATDGTELDLTRVPVAELRGN